MAYVAGRGRRTGVPWKAFAGIGLVLGVAAALVRAKSTEPKARRVALIGDSYAVGLGPELQKLLPDFKFEGRVGVGTRSYVVPSWIGAFKPTLMLVSLGVNDGTDPQRNNYVEILRQLYAAGISNVVWIEPPTGTRFTPRLHNLLATLGVRVIPAVTTPLKTDQIHPKSYAPWAQAIARAVTT